MGYQLPFKSPYTGLVIDTAYGWIGELNMNFLAKVGRIVVIIHESRDAKLNGYPPIGQFVWTPQPTAIPARPAVLDSAGNVVIPEEPEFPSFDDLILMSKTNGTEPVGTPLFGLVKATFYQFLKTRPQLANATDLQD